MNRSKRTIGSSEPGLKRGDFSPGSQVFKPHLLVRLIMDDFYLGRVC